MSLKYLSCLHTLPTLQEAKNSFSLSRNQFHYKLDIKIRIKFFKQQVPKMGNVLKSYINVS